MQSGFNRSWIHWAIKNQGEGGLELRQAAVGQALHHLRRILGLEPPTLDAGKFRAAAPFDRSVKVNPVAAIDGKAVVRGKGEDGMIRAPFKFAAHGGREDEGLGRGAVHGLVELDDEGLPWRIIIHRKVAHQLPGKKVGQVGRLRSGWVGFVDGDGFSAVGNGRRHHSSCLGLVTLTGGQYHKEYE